MRINASPWRLSWAGNQRTFAINVHACAEEIPGLAVGETRATALELASQPFGETFRLAVVQPAQRPVAP